MSVAYQNDFDRGIMDQVAHRPYPTPQTPWLMTQTWHDLLVRVRDMEDRN